MSTLLRLTSALLLLLVAARADDRWAPHAVAGPVNQRVVSGNACGPAALLAALRSGSERWRKIPARIPGDAEKSQLLYIIRAHGLVPSASLKKRKRWTGEGINPEDLADIAGELAAIGGMPRPRSESLFTTRREDPGKLLRRLHGRLHDSLAKGLPPILSLRRFVWRDGHWQAVQGHFVTVVRVPEKLPRGAENFTFTYFDPWGGLREEGTLTIPITPVLSPDGRTSTCLVAEVPRANLGRDKIRPGEKTLIVPTYLTGRW